MGLDIYEYGRQKGQKRKKGTPRHGNYLMSLSESDFALLAAINDAYKQKTGVYIDEYGTTILYRDHIELLTTIIANHEDTLSAPEKDKFTVKFAQLKVILNNAIESEINLRAEGD